MSPPRTTHKSGPDLGNRSVILPVHKPSGPTSRRVVDEVQVHFEDAKIGHGGTLDPLAEGLLPLHFNEATKVVDYLHEQPKSYRVRCRFDLKSPSLDLGETVSSTPATDPPPERQVREAVADFVGEVEQVPPDYSAIKMDGQPLYERARSGNVNDGPRSRNVVCESARVLHYDYPALTVQLTCGEGFYVRSMVRDLAEDLDQNGGIVTALVRTAYGPYELSEAARLYEKPERWAPAARPLESALGAVPFRECDEEELKRIVHGGRIPRTRIDSPRAAATGSEGRVHALLEPDPSNPGGTWKPKRVLNRGRR